LQYIVGSNKKVYLDFAPKKGTLVVTDFIVVEDVVPISGQVSIKWATDSYAANILTFHASAIGQTVEVTYSPHLFLLQNLDASLTATRTEVKKVDVNGQIRLDGIPKKDTIVIPTMTVVIDTIPNSSQAAIVWGDDYNYVISTGMLTFNPINIGQEYAITYVPIASRVDATIINKFLEYYNEFSGEVWTKTEMANSTTGPIVHWDNIINHPTLVNDSVDGLMPHSLYTLLAAMNSQKPIGAIYAGDNTYAVPSTWGGAIQLQNTPTVTTTVIGPNIKFDVVQSAFTQLSANTTAALDGTSGVANATNKFVTNSDARMSNARPAQPHEHTFSSVYSAIDNPLEPAKNLTNALSGKAALSHTHSMSDVQDFPNLLIPTSLQKAALDGTGNFYVKDSDTRLLSTFPHTPSTHAHAINDVTNLSSSLDFKASLKHQHGMEDIPGLGTASPVSNMVRTTKFLHDYVIQGLDTVTTGVKWSRTSPVTTWVALHAYSLGDCVLPTVLNGYIYKVVQAGTSSSTEPSNWASTSVSDGTVIWSLIAAATVWAASTVYRYGNNVLSTAKNYYYTCTFPGVSYSSEPPWGTLVTETTPTFVATKNTGLCYSNGIYTQFQESSYGRPNVYVGMLSANQTVGVTTGKRLYATTSAVVKAAKVYDIKVTVANASSTNMTGLMTQWRVNPAGSWSANIDSSSGTAICDANIGYAFDAAQYAVNDQWTITVSVDCDWYDFIDSNSTIYHVPVNHAAAIPTSPVTGALILCKVVTNGSGIASVTDKRDTSMALNFGDMVTLKYDSNYPNTVTMNGAPLVANGVASVLASGVASTPSGNIAATNVQAALDELDSEKAPKLSPTFTGTVGGISAIMISNVPQGYISATNVQSALVELDLEKAPLDNPHFTGTVVGITAAMVGSTATGDVSATTVQSAIAELASEKATKLNPAFSGTATGLTASMITSTATGDVASTNVQSAIAELASEKAPLSSPIFTGTVGGITGAMITNTPAGNIASVTVQAAINELDTEKAPLANPAFTGTVSGITAAMIGSTTTGDVAATNVQAAIAELASEKAPLVSPTFTGTVNGISALMVNAVPVGGVVSVDMNTFKTSTVIYATTSAHLPETYCMVSIIGDGTSCSQTATGVNTAKVYSRVCVNGTWIPASSWNQIYPPVLV
jgi:hypothetical protein